MVVRTGVASTRVGWRITPSQAESLFRIFSCATIDADDYFIVDSNYHKAQMQVSTLAVSEIPAPTFFASDDDDAAHTDWIKDDLL